MKKDCDFVVLTSARSGSTNLVDTLDTHPELHCLREIFGSRSVPVHLIGRHTLPLLVFKEPFRIVRRAAPPFAVRLALPHIRKANVRYGYKVLGHQLWEYRLVDYLKAQRKLGVKFIHLIRRSSLDQSVSWLTALQTQVFHSNSKRPWKRNLKAEDIPDSLIQSMVREYDLMKAFVAETAAALDSLDVYFEDFEKKEGFFQPILRFLEVDDSIALIHQHRRLSQEPQASTRKGATGSPELNPPAFSHAYPDRKHIWRPAPPPPWRRCYWR